MKKTLGIIVLSLLLSGNSFADNKVNLSCTFEDGTKLEPVLDFDNSLFYNSINGSPWNMVFDKNSIQIVMAPKPGGLFNAIVLEISRLTGNGKFKSYKLSDNQYEEVKLDYSTKILLAKIGNTEDKSLDMAREKIITETIVNFVKDKKIADTTLLTCEKIEGNKF